MFADGTVYRTLPFLASPFHKFLVLSFSGGSSRRTAVTGMAITGKAPCRAERRGVPVECRNHDGSRGLGSLRHAEDIPTGSRDAAAPIYTGPWKNDEPGTGYADILYPSGTEDGVSWCESGPCEAIATRGMFVMAAAMARAPCGTRAPVLRILVLHV